MGNQKEQKANPSKQKKENVVTEYAKAIAWAVGLALLVRFFVVQPFQIPSGSMIPTLLVGDRLLVTKFSYGVRNPYNNKVWVEVGKPQRWDVVVFIPPNEPKQDYVKRVVGMPGETIEMVNGKILINGQYLEDPHGQYDSSIMINQWRSFKPVVIPEGHYFMMGDNRDHSNDSRAWGVVKFDALKGKAWRFYWSWDSDPKIDIADSLRASRIGMKIE